MGLFKFRDLGSVVAQSERNTVGDSLDIVFSNRLATVGKERLANRRSPSMASSSRVMGSTGMGCSKSAFRVSVPFCFRVLAEDNG